jgi:hypothetical protein
MLNRLCNVINYGAYLIGFLLIISSAYSAYDAYDKPWVKYGGKADVGTSILLLIAAFVIVICARTFTYILVGNNPKSE